MSGFEVCDTGSSNLDPETDRLQGGASGIQSLVESVRKEADRLVEVNLGSDIWEPAYR